MKPITCSVLFGIESPSQYNGIFWKFNIFGKLSHPCKYIFLKLSKLANCRYGFSVREEQSAKRAKLFSKLEKFKPFKFNVIKLEQPENIYSILVTLETFQLLKSKDCNEVQL